MTDSVTFVVPALNEQENIEAAAGSILQAAKAAGNPSCQILILDDGSADATGTIIDRLAAQYPRIQAIHNQKTMGLGFNYFHGLELAKGEYVIMVPGDNEIPEPAIRTILEQRGKADLIIPYMTGSHARPLGRRIISRGFVLCLNALLGLRLRYYNGPCLLRTDLVRRVKVRTHGFAYMAAVLATLIRSGHTYTEVAVPLQYRQHGGSKAVTWRNIWSVIRTVTRLWIDVRFSKGAP